MKRRSFAKRWIYFTKWKVYLSHLPTESRRSLHVVKMDVPARNPPYWVNEHRFQAFRTHLVNTLAGCLLIIHMYTIHLAASSNGYTARIIISSVVLSRLEYRTAMSMQEEFFHERLQRTSPTWPWSSMIITWQVFFSQQASAFWLASSDHLND